MRSISNTAIDANSSASSLSGTSGMSVAGRKRPRGEASLISVSLMANQSVPIILVARGPAVFICWGSHHHLSTSCPMGCSAWQLLHVSPSPSNNAAGLRQPAPEDRFLAQLRESSPLCEFASVSTPTACFYYFSPAPLASDLPFRVSKTVESSSPDFLFCFLGILRWRGRPVFPRENRLQNMAV